MASNTDPVRSTIAPVGVVDQIAAVYSDEILQGVYPRGYQLRQAEICSRFGVSRTPARDVLNRLHGSGLIRLVPNKSAVIDLPTLQQLAEVYEIRAELEALAAARVARRRDPDSVARLISTQHRINDVMGALAQPSDIATIPPNTVEQLRALNDEFHTLVHNESGNSRLVDEIASLTRLFPKDAVFRAIRSSEDLLRLYVSDHAELLDRLAAGDQESARMAMRGHISASLEMLTEYLRAQGYPEN
ncbi:GntR family transcriptional regulator [Gordonia otitidis]|uniref:GntR family transcriptional regulator n=1 Tax=Gordonia otitidis TaxID=249058 RepID=UPI001D15BDCF|nr:GntR family transcriptional regulator [Gordonia otitidis]UEA59933.1 GntR family transcriptional regulator [Gordonia otitidis]